MAESQNTTLTPAEAQNIEFQDAHVQKHSPSSKLSNEPIILDIEHAVVEDDPRIWSNTRKVCAPISTQDQGLIEHLQNAILFIISAASVIAGLSANIQNRELCP